MLSHIKVGDLIRFGDTHLINLKNKIGIVFDEKYEPKIINNMIYVLFSDKNITILSKPILIYYLDIGRITILNK